MCVRVYVTGNVRRLYDIILTLSEGFETNVQMSDFGRRFEHLAISRSKITLAERLWLNIINTHLF